LLFVLFQILYWLAALGIAHTYLFYPVLIKWLARGRELNTNTYTPTDELPEVVILMAVYNEEGVISQKLHSIFDTHYPLNKVKLWIGSDNSTDKTHSVITQFKHRYPQLELTVYEGRNGKPRILNRLMEANAHRLPPDTVLVLTDANVLFTPQLLFQLVKHFKNPTTGVVGANVLNIGVKETGISFQEMWYIRRENVVKHYESIAGGCMMGAFGACFALRSPLYEPIPPNFVVDDFYLTMVALERRFTALKELEAVCYEDVSEDISEEYRRKKRISSGNFQNLHRFKKLLLPQNGMVAFCFFSHKVLRWFTPGLWMVMLLISGYLAMRTNVYHWLFVMQLATLLPWFADAVLSKVNINVKLFRFVRYFYLMNLGLLIGFLTYLKGIDTNVWKPTKRNT